MPQRLVLKRVAVPVGADDGTRSRSIRSLRSSQDADAATGPASRGVRRRPLIAARARSSCAAHVELLVVAAMLQRRVARVEARGAAATRAPCATGRARAPCTTGWASAISSSERRRGAHRTAAAARERAILRLVGRDAAQSRPPRNSDRRRTCQHDEHDALAGRRSWRRRASRPTGRPTRCSTATTGSRTSRRSPPACRPSCQIPAARPAWASLPRLELAQRARRPRARRGCPRTACPAASAGTRRAARTTGTSAAARSSTNTAAVDSDERRRPARAS